MHGKFSVKSLFVTFDRVVELHSSRVICANDASNQSCKICSRQIFRMRETEPQRRGLHKKSCRILIPNNEITSWFCRMRPVKRKNWKIPLLSFIALPLKLHKIREHAKNTYLLQKLLWHLTDNCMNTSPRLVRKCARIFVYRHYLFQNASGPKTHFLHINKWIALYEF